MMMNRLLGDKEVRQRQWHPPSLPLSIRPSLGSGSEEVPVDVWLDLFWKCN